MTDNQRATTRRQVERPYSHNREGTHNGTYAHDLIELGGVQIALDLDSEVVYVPSIFCPCREKRRSPD